MTSSIRTLSTLLIGLFLAVAVQAGGPVGNHVNELQEHLDEYASEIDWLMAQIDDMVAAYETGGAEAARPATIVDHWEAVKFHSAIETNYIPLYASIWQGLFGVRTAMEAGRDLDAVREQQERLEQALWQSLGAVKVAARFQERGLLQEVATREAATPAGMLVEIKQRLDRVLAKYAERLPDEAIEIVQETYVTRFEAVEDVLIEEDAELAENLEVDFNVHLPQAIQRGRSVDEVRDVIAAMHGKLDRARALLKAVSS